MKYTHLFLKNPIGTKKYVSKLRGFNNEDEEEEEEIIRNYSYQKEYLGQKWNIFIHEREERIKQRSITIPYHFEYIQITFYRDFNNNGNLYTNQFGLVPIRYTDFNQTVLFLIQDEERFMSGFVALLKCFCESPCDENPAGTQYHIITLISSFVFLSSHEILADFYNTSYNLFSLSENIYIRKEQATLKNLLSQYILDKSGKIEKIADNVWQIENLNSDDIYTIANNFDIVQKVQSIPPIRVSPSKFSMFHFGWDINTIVQEGIPSVGIIDTGVDNIEPFRDIYLPPMSILPSMRHSIQCDHGTNVASMAVFGKELSLDTKNKVAATKILSIQVLQNSTGYFSFRELQQAVIKAHQEFGVRIFNLSIVSKGKGYNTGISPYATMLDEIAYNQDVLIFIATGNLECEDIENIIAYQTEKATPEEYHFLTYPNHFYGPDFSIACCHECECTNLCEPAESMNNITVGAIAENFEIGGPDLTLRKDLPTYYTRKYYIDYAKPVIKGTRFTKNQKNKNIFKPDIVMPGGDWLAEDAQMIVLGRGETPQEYYKYAAGTSLATPLAVNLAARILFHYPNISMQSVKALIINSAEITGSPILVHEIIAIHKEKMAQNIYHKSFIDLSRSEKMKISQCYNEEQLYKNLIGHGLPNEEKCLFSSDKRVTFLIEETIVKDSYKVVNLKLPDYLLSSRKESILTLIGTLCFKFLPDSTNQLGYNPLHIGFKFVKACGNSQYLAELISNEPENKIRPHSAEELEQMLKIKSNISWSEDFYPQNGRIFSNTQKMNINMRVKDLININNEIGIIFRCVGKDSILEEETHSFSFVLSVEEKENSGLSENLYENLIAINEIENINEVVTEIETEAVV